MKPSKSTCRNYEKYSIPQSFQTKKQQILSSLSVTQEEGYEDKSPKGSVDEQIRDLIDLINGCKGFVTTSSCAGRVAVFVEGPNLRKADLQGEQVSASIAEFGGIEDEKKTEAMRDGLQPRTGKAEDDCDTVGEAYEVKRDAKTDSTASDKTRGRGPGGKGGGKWLYVSHDPIPQEAMKHGHLTELFGLKQHLSTTTSNEGAVEQILSNGDTSTSPRLIHLSFSPLILHILCASLHHAKPLLSAAINSGFRESGVQSLKGLDDLTTGTMVAVRTAGLAFETVIGIVDGNDQMRCVVSEEYLQLCINIINERFEWNEMRKSRFRDELHKHLDKDGHGSLSHENAKVEVTERIWEDEDARRERKKREGLQKQKQQREQMIASKNEVNQVKNDESVLDIDLSSLEIR